MTHGKTGACAGAVAWSTPKMVVCDTKKNWALRGAKNHHPPQPKGRQNTWQRAVVDLVVGAAHRLSLSKLAANYTNYQKWSASFTKIIWKSHIYNIM